MITLVILITLYKLNEIRKAWKYSKSLCDKKYILNEFKDYVMINIVLTIIWASIKWDIVYMAFN